MNTLLTILLIAVTAVAAEAVTKVRQSDIDRVHVTILGITVGVDGMASVEKRLGRTKLFNFNRGTRKSPVDALCYVSADSDDSTRLLFVAGPEGRELKVAQARITAGDVEVKYGLRCLTSKAVGKGLATVSGLKLGITPAEVKLILGDPTDEAPGFLGYEFHLQRKLTETEISEIEIGRPAVRKYPYHDISASVEARFADGILKRLDIIRFSTY
jgi:hypothetical protein